MNWMPTKHIIGHIRDGFLRINNPTDSVKGPKEVIVVRRGFNPTRSTSPCYNPTHACNIQWQTK